MSLISNDQILNKKRIFFAITEQLCTNKRKIHIPITVSKIAHLRATDKVGPVNVFFRKIDLVQVVPEGSGHASA